MYVREIILSYYMGFKYKKARALLHNRRRNFRFVYNRFRPFFHKLHREIEIEPKKRKKAGILSKK